MLALELLRSHPRVLAFGASCRLVGGVGQTFFISLFVPEFALALGLERTGVSSLYAGATLAAGLALPVAGRAIDRVPLKLFASLVGVGLFFACLGVALAEHIVVLGLALFALRLTGQGLMAHTSITSMARFFTHGRATALSLSFLGHPLAEAVFPFAAALAVSALGWRAVWFIAAGGALVFVASTLLLLAGRDTRPAAFTAPTSTPDPVEERPAWTRMDLVVDARFWALLPFWVAPAFVLTGMFFHQVALAEEKGWTRAFLASAFVAFAVTQTASSFLAGGLVDRLGAGRVLPLHLAPLGLGLAALSLGDGPWVAWLYMALAGVTIGLIVTAKTPWLASVVGTANLGGIRSLLVAIAVASTSASPPIFSLLLDAGFSMTQMALTSAGYIAVASVVGTLAMAALRRDPRPRAQRGQPASSRSRS